MHLRWERAINPRARIHLQWSTMKDAHTDEYFLSHGISYISSQNMISPTKEDRALGLYHLTENGAKNIATTVYQWGAFYEELINSIMRGSWKTDTTKEPKALNYWWGLSANVLDVILGSSVPTSTRKLVDFMKMRSLREITGCFPENYMIKIIISAAMQTRRCSLKI